MLFGCIMINIDASFGCFYIGSLFPWKERKILNQALHFQISTRTKFIIMIIISMLAQKRLRDLSSFNISCYSFHRRINLLTLFNTHAQNRA